MDNFSINANILEMYVKKNNQEKYSNWIAHFEYNF